MAMLLNGILRRIISMLYMHFFTAPHVDMLVFYDPPLEYVGNCQSALSYSLFLKLNI